MKTANLSVLDGIRCLQAVISANQPLGVREVSRRLEFETARTHRLLKSLAASGMLAQNAQRRYYAGPALHVFSAQALTASGLLPAALPVVDQLHDLKLIVAVGVLWGSDVTYLIHRQANRPLTSAIAREPAFPASRSAIGLALLAEQDDQTVRALYPNKSVIPGFSGGTKELLTCLRLTRKRGYAVALQGSESNRETWSIGVALPHVPAAGIAVSGIIATEDHEALAARLIAAADEIKPQFNGKGL
jgi:DNA-binding IclR family transcriptional regulator